MRIHAIINPVAAGNRAAVIEAELKRELAESLVSMHESRYSGDATYSARRAIAGGVDHIVVVGGDGTVNEVCNAVVDHDVALGIIPMGTANDLACSLQLPCDVTEACRAIKEGGRRSIDAIRVNGWYYVTVGGLGIPSHALAAAERIKGMGAPGDFFRRVFGSRLYVLGLLFAMANHRRWHNLLTVTVDGVTFDVDAFSLTVGNQATLGGHFRLSPNAVDDDGLLDLCVLCNGVGTASMLKTVTKTFAGRHVSLPTVTSLRGWSAQVTSPVPVSYFADGEIVRTGTSFTIEVVQQAITVVVPQLRKEVSRVA